MSSGVALPAKGTASRRLSQALEFGDGSVDVDSGDLVIIS